jgi:hypothetical protein
MNSSLRKSVFFTSVILYIISINTDYTPIKTYLQTVYRQITKERKIEYKIEQQKQITVLPNKDNVVLRDNIFLSMSTTISNMVIGKDSIMKTSNTSIDVYCRGSP